MNEAQLGGVSAPARPAASFRRGSAYEAFMSDLDHLHALALAIRPKAYAPYSKFQVGAAVLADNGLFYQGVNVENAAYPEGTCAEAGAIAAMVAGGGRKIKAIHVVADSPDPVPCCGGCRQKISEFADSSMVIVISNLQGKTKSYGIDDLLPGRFGPEDMALVTE